MEKKKYSVEDFVLDQQFRKWVFEPDLESMEYWEAFMASHPTKTKEMARAREILLHMAKVNHPVSRVELMENWSQVLKKVEETAPEEKAAKTVFLHSKAALEHPREPRGYQPPAKGRRKFLKIASLTLLVATVGLLVQQRLFREDRIEQVQPVLEWTSFEAPKGAKTVVSLHDGSKVSLNSGSRIRYRKNFEGPIREVFLEGEALFEVAKDPEKPFVVLAAGMLTEALGTVFNIDAFDGTVAQVSLLEGSVGVRMQSAGEPILLLPGESVIHEQESEGLRKGKFDTEEVLAWTNKTLYFKGTPVRVVIGELENWYGVEISMLNSPPANLRVTGKYHDQTLRNVLEGLSYSANFDYEMEADKINLRFNY